MTRFSVARASIPAFALALAPFVASAAFAQQDGARGYMLPPEGTHGVLVFTQFFTGSRTTDSGAAVVGSRVTSFATVFEYAHPFSVAGNFGAFFVVQPIGTTHGSIDVAGAHSGNRSGGFGDSAFGAEVGLIGMPALPLKSYLEYKPGFSATAVATVSVPTGNYDRTKIFNFGTNRWAFRTALPIVYTLGRSFADPELMTFELKPTVTFYTANSAPFGARWQTQDPLFELEGHVTRNFTNALWVSADGIYYNGGRTRTNGVADPNSRRSELNLGGTIGLSLTQTLQLRASYSHSVAHNEAPLVGQGARLMLLGSF